jgi:hypothetical protein
MEVTNERLQDYSGQKEMVSRSARSQAAGLIRALQPQLDQIPRAASSMRPPTKIKKNMEGSAGIRRYQKKIRTWPSTKSWRQALIRLR